MGAIIAGLCANLNVDVLKQNLQKTSYLSFGLSVLAILVGIGFTTKRWQEIISCHSAPIPLSDLWKQNMVGTFINQCLPGSVSGDVYRGFIVKRYGVSKDWAISSTILDRVVGLMGLIFAGIVSLPFVISRLTETYLGFLVAILLATIGLLFIFLIIIAKYVFGKHKELTSSKSIKNVLFDFFMLLYSILNQGRKTIIIMLCSLIGTITFIIPLYLTCQSMHIPLMLPELFVCLSTVFLLSIIPVSLAGWGVREGAMVIILSLFGIDKEQALCLSIIFGLVQLVASIPGALLLMLCQPYSLKNS